MAAGLPKPPQLPAAKELHAAHSILAAAHRTTDAFADAFDIVRSSRKAKGAPTDEEQDLLRAMLLFAGAGLDSMIKQLTRDALSRVLERDLGAQKLFQEFIERRLRQRETGAERIVTLDTKFVANILSDPSPRAALIRDLIASLTAASLQSKDQVLLAAAHFGIPSASVTQDPSRLAEVFNMRNQIAHEMDVDLTAKKRKRRSRTRDGITAASSTLLTVGAAFLKEVNKKLSP